MYLGYPDEKSKLGEQHLQVPWIAGRKNKISGVTSAGTLDIRTKKQN
jgi:hypothetical protein